MKKLKKIGNSKATYTIIKSSCPCGPCSCSIACQGIYDSMGNPYYKNMDGSVESGYNNTMYRQWYG